MTDYYLTKPLHYNREPRRKAQFIKPPNTLKAKLGYGGLDESILEKAQALLENNNVDFYPLGEMYLSVLDNGIEKAFRQQRDSGENIGDQEAVIYTMLYPAMQLKANGGMFRYPLVTRIADRLIQFLEVIERPDPDAIEIVIAFHTTVKAIVQGRIDGDGGKYGDDLVAALDEACMRYFERHPDNVHPERSHSLLRD